MRSRRQVRDHVFRYLIISIVFCAVCVFYIGRLFYIQISGRQNQYEKETVRTVTVQAVRGEIYDRNGKKLVSNRYWYNLVLSRAAFSLLPNETSNRSCLKLLEAIDACNEQERRAVSYELPMYGAYPYYAMSENFASENPAAYQRMLRIMAQNDLDETTATPQELIDTYVEKYDLLATDGAGNRLYTDAQVDRIIRMRYDMDATLLNDSQNYTFATDLGTSSNLIVYVSEQNLPGVSFTFDMERVYMYPDYATYILGSVGSIWAEEWEYYNQMGYPMNAVVGKSGCEAAFESYLHGVDGKMEIEVDEMGNVIRETMLQEPVSGKDIYLTIDIDLQIAAEEGLRENIDYVHTLADGDASKGAGCDVGAAVVLDPNTFEVLAMASESPDGMNWAIMSKDDEGNDLFYGFSPGSTFKLGVAVAALMEGEINTDTKLNCNGNYAGFMPCTAHSKGSNAYPSLTTAISQSCNSYFCECGSRLGIERLEYYMSAFGFGQDTGFELGGITGILGGISYRESQNSDREWTAGDMYNTAIGQGETTASPLQVASYLATLCNGGTRKETHLLHSVYEFGNDTPIYVNDPQILSELNIPADVLDVVSDGMREVVTSHSNISKYMKNIPVEVGGKTGTVQVYGQNCENAFFVAAAPYDEAEIVISVFLQEGAVGERASLTAARILEAYYNGLQSE